MPGLSSAKRFNAKVKYEGPSQHNLMQIHKNKSDIMKDIADKNYTRKSGSKSKIETNNFRNRSKTMRDIEDQTRRRQIGVDSLKKHDINDYKYNR